LETNKKEKNQNLRTGGGEDPSKEETCRNGLRGMEWISRLGVVGTGKGKKAVGRGERGFKGGGNGRDKRTQGRAEVKDLWGGGKGGAG